MAGCQTITADFGHGEETLYFDKRNLDQLDAVMQAQKESPVAVFVTTLITRCMTEHGSFAYGESDRKRIRKDFDPVEVMRVCGVIREFDVEVETSGN